ncbi:hypothetical protein SAMN05216319_2356 [Duganella sp. CF402]|uniref:hypothetical protein n=1 Tax=unclassified Duganella TaxID=2636909 RepID=UPI0008C4973C|nr:MULTISPECIES: hypothetical protein [unclassified Duganella]RZT09221.1 hypothetical protein EV582_1265 [Duganella sp. BK701]SEL65926.1 hypothetical protein SAMN05216319_2356 [Duganella sp. CF402]
MKIIDQRYLESDNRYSTQPCLLSILELDPVTPEATEKLQQRLYNTLPGLHRLRGLVGKRADAVPPIVELVQQTAIELRRLALNEVTVGFVGVVPRMQGRYRLVLPSIAAAPALAMATQLVNAMLAGRSYNLKAGLARLRALADRRCKPRAPSRLQQSRVVFGKPVYDVVLKFFRDRKSIINVGFCG